jgi:hypothetical protein
MATPQPVRGAIMTTKPKNQPRLTKRFWIGRRGVFALWATAGLIFLGPAAPRSEAADRTWISNSGYWMTAGNWQGDVAPAVGDNLLFSAGTLSIYSTNDYPSGTTFGQINIGTGRFAGCTLAGLPITLTNGMVTTGPSLGLAANVDCNITLGHDQTFSATRVLNIAGNVDVNFYQLTVNNSGNVNFSGTLSNSSVSEETGLSLVKTNTGTLTISSGAQLTPQPGQLLGVEVDQGSLVMAGEASNVWFFVDQGLMVLDGVAYAAETDFSGATVSGTGMAAGSLQSENGGVFSPGDNGAPGVLRCNEFFLDTVYELPGTLQITINGTTPGADYGQMLVYSNYSLSTAPYQSGVLDVQWGYTPQIGDSFLVLQQMSAEPYQIQNSGMFFGLSPDSIYDATNGYSFIVSYDTNGVTLTTFLAPDSPFIFWKGSQTTVDGFTTQYADRRWSLTNNWAQGLVPGSGSQVQFTPHQISCYYGAFAYIAPPPLTNDLAVGTSVASLSFSDTNYVLYGNGLTITGGITNGVGSGTNSILLGLAVVGSLTLDVDAGGTLLLGGSFNGSGTVHKEDGGTLHYTGTTMNSFVGSVVVDSGTLQLDGSFTDGSFAVNGGLLDGTGVVSSVTMNGGTLKPGDSPGVLVIQGNLTMTTDSVFQVELNGPFVGSSYDQLQVNGTVNLNGATLELQPGFAAAPGTAFLILVNDGTDPVVGTFAGLPEGAVFQAAGQYFSISYQAGSGNNDVVVTRVNPPGNFSNILRLNAGTIQLQGIGGSNVNYSILANTNLATTNWVNIGTAPANGTGVFLFNDTNVLLFPQQFFRVLSP